MEEHNGVPPHKHGEVTSFSTKELPQQWFNLGVSKSMLPGLTTNWIFIQGFVKDDVQILPILIILNEMRDQILIATVRSEQSLLKSVGHKVKYCLDVCRP